MKRTPRESEQDINRDLSQDPQFPRTVISSEDTKILTRWPSDQPNPELTMGMVGDVNAFPLAVSTLYDRNTFEEIGLTDKISRGLLYHRGSEDQPVVVNLPNEVLDPREGEFINEDSFRTIDRRAVYNQIAAHPDVDTVLPTANAEGLETIGGAIEFSPQYDSFDGQRVEAQEAVHAVNVQDNVDELGGALGWGSDAYLGTLERPSGIWSQVLEEKNSKGPLIEAAREINDQYGMGVFVPETDTATDLGDVLDVVKSDQSSYAVKINDSGGKYGDQVIFAYPDDSLETLEDRVFSKERDVRGKNDRADDFSLVNLSGDFVGPDGEPTEALMVEGVLGEVDLDGETHQVLGYDDGDQVNGVDVPVLGYFDADEEALKPGAATFRIGTQSQTDNVNSGFGNFEIGDMKEAVEGNVDSLDPAYNLIDQIERQYDREVEDPEVVKEQFYDVAKDTALLAVATRNETARNADEYARKVA